MLPIVSYKVPSTTDDRYTLYIHVCTRTNARIYNLFLTFIFFTKFQYVHALDEISLFLDKITRFVPRSE